MLISVSFAYHLDRSTAVAHGGHHVHHVMEHYLHHTLGVAPDYGPRYRTVCYPVVTAADYLLCVR